MTTNTPQVAINDIGSTEDLLAAIDETIKYFNDGDIVEGTVVKVDHDEVLLDIGYKTEGVILSRELSIKHDVNPDDVVAVGDQVEALVLQKEDKEGRLLLSKKRAQYERREQGGVGQQPLHLHGVGRRIVGIDSGRHSGAVAAHAHEREEEEKCEHNIQGEGKEKGQSGSTSK